MAIFAPSFSQKSSPSPQTISEGKQALMTRFYAQMKASVGVESKAVQSQSQKQQQRFG